MRKRFHCTFWKGWKAVRPGVVNPSPGVQIIFSSTLTPTVRLCAEGYEANVRTVFVLNHVVSMAIVGRQKPSMHFKMVFASKIQVTWLLL